MSEWRKIVRDANEVKLFEALEDPKYEWRSLKALKRESGMTEQEVLQVLNRHRSLVREARSQAGESIWTLQERYWKRGGLTQILDFISHTSTSTS